MALQCQKVARKVIHLNQKAKSVQTRPVHYNDSQTFNITWIDMKILP
jgi:hypothetical protein